MKRIGTRCCRACLVFSCLLQDVSFGFSCRPRTRRHSISISTEPALNVKSLTANAKHRHDDEGEENFGGRGTESGRREFISWSSAVAAAFGSPDPSQASASVASAAQPGSAVPRPKPDVKETIPFSSVRRYKTISLPGNNLRVLLVRDVAVRQSTAALTIADAGQFADPVDLPGLAHLMEHMILSYCNDCCSDSSGQNTSRRPSFAQRPSSRDFEDWLSSDAAEGASNAFTGYDKVCFYFSCRHEAFGEALERFAQIFWPRNVQCVCSNDAILRREVRRVNAELDFASASTQAYYLLKDFINDEHPFSRFSAGSLESLESTPKARGVDVGKRLIEFFQSRYLPENAVLVVIGPQDFLTLERKVASFAKSFSNKVAVSTTRSTYPGGFLRGTRPKQLILYRQDDSKFDNLSFNFALDVDYRLRGRSRNSPVSVNQICFVLSQILGRRGPGSLYFFLSRRGWIAPGQNSIPRLSIPLDVSGFQIIRLDIPLTTDGFKNRSAIVAAVYNILNSLVQSGTVAGLSRTLLTQYAAIAKLNGYFFVARPPDAVELAVDAQFYGLGSQGAGSGRWYRFPDEKAGIDALRREVYNALLALTDPDNSVIIATASIKTLSDSGDINGKSASVKFRNWLYEPLSRGRFCYDDMFTLTSKVEVFLLRKIIDDEEIQLPVLNPLVPAAIRPPRLFLQSLGQATDASSSLTVNKWIILTPKVSPDGSLLPRGPPEPTCRCVLVIELLSSRPARATVRQAAQAELWKVSFENSVSDLLELGSFGGIGLDLSFNKFGLRLAFLGISQTLPSYVRRMSRRLINHHTELFDGGEFFPRDVIQKAIMEAKNVRGLTSLRRSRFISSIRRTTTYEAGAEGREFLRSCHTAACFAEGDLLPNEVSQLVADLQNIFITANGYALAAPSVPKPEDIMYKAQWRPRGGSPCIVPGASLINDTCGRILR